MKALSLWCLILILTSAPASGQTENGGKTLVFFGDSLTAGYGLNVDEAYPALIQRRIDKLGLKVKVVNSGVSGDTTAGGLSRLSWSLRTQPNIFVLALGANDGLRGIPTAVTEQNIISIIKKIREKNPETVIVVAGMEIPTNLGETYRKDFRELFSRVAKQENTHFIPFLLEGVAGNAELNQADGIHPTAAGQEKIAESVWKILQPLLS